MGSIGNFSKRRDAAHIAQCLAAACFAGLVLTMGARQAQADWAPIPPAPEAEPASPRRTTSHRSDRADATPADAAVSRLPLVQVSIVSKPLELSLLAPEAFADWDIDAR